MVKLKFLPFYSVSSSTLTTMPVDQVETIYVVLHQISQCAFVCSNKFQMNIGIEISCGNVKKDILYTCPLFTGGN